jgi:hypothetical protein
MPAGAGAGPVRVTPENPMRHHSRALLALGVLPLAAGCNLFGPRDCTMDMHPAIEVEVRSAEAGAWLANDATGVVTEGAYSDSLRPSRGTSVNGGMLWMALRGADERPGTYRVEVSVPGYVPWVRENVRVRDGECHVGSVGLEARLQPAAP